MQTGGQRCSCSNAKKASDSKAHSLYVHTITGRWQCLITFNTCPSSPSLSLYSPPSLSSFSIFILFPCKSLETEIFCLAHSPLRAREPASPCMVFVPLMRWRLSSDAAAVWCMQILKLSFVKENPVLEFTRYSLPNLTPAAHICRIATFSSLPRACKERMTQLAAPCCTLPYPSHIVSSQLSYTYSYLT